MMVSLGATAAAAVTNYTQRNVRSLSKNCLYTVASQQNDNFNYKILIKRNPCVLRIKSE